MKIIVKIRKRHSDICLSLNSSLHGQNNALPAWSQGPNLHAQRNAAAAAGGVFAKKWKTNHPRRSTHATGIPDALSSQPHCRPRPQ
jgi:hypothetical protein